MNENEIVIQNSIATWSMPRTLGELGGTYTGTFVFRCYLSPTQQLEAGREYRSLLGDMGHAASEVENNLAFALTQLKQRIMKSPPFWSTTQQESGIAGNVGDINIILAVLTASLKAEEMFKDNIKKEREEILNKSIKSGEDLQQKGKE